MAIKLTHRCANALLEYARENGLEELYRQALQFDMETPSELKVFLESLPGGIGERDSILRVFIEKAREELGLLEAEVISAVPLKPAQLKKVEEKLARMSGKKLEVTTSVDPALLGGVKAILGGTVFDDSIKQKMSDMKKSICDRVYGE